MKPKKNEQVNLEIKKKSFFAIGITIAVAVVLCAFEWRSEDKVDITIYKGGIEIDDTPLPPITKPPLPPEPPKLKPPVIKIDIVDDKKQVDDFKLISQDDNKKPIDEFVPNPIPEPDIDVDKVYEPEIYLICDEMPLFPGGEEEMYGFISKNLKYPAIAVENGIQGMVYVGFVVEGTGEISNIKIERGIGGTCDEEAVRIMKLMPKWKPGKQRGKPVRVAYNLPIRFKLK